jgi:hypothetical protein
VGTFIVVFNAVLHLLFETPYLLERTTLVLYPLLVVGFFFILAEVRFSLFKQHALSALIIALFFFICYNFYSSFSTKTFREWPVQSDTGKGIEYLKSFNAKKVGMGLWHHDVFVNYYLHAFPDKYSFQFGVVPELTEVNSVTEGSLLKFDFLLLHPPYREIIPLQQWTLVQNFAGSGTRVYKRKQ